jgi:DNA-binding response OmpR family regulator
MGYGNQDTFTDEAVSEGNPASPAIGKARVLVLGLNGWNCQTLVQALREAEYAVQAVGTTAEALDVLTCHGADLILVVGPANTMAYRRLRRASRLPMLALALYAGESQMLTAYRAGVDQFESRVISSREAVARTRALLRRGPRGESAIAAADASLGEGKPGGHLLQLIAVVSRQAVGARHPREAMSRARWSRGRSI